MRLKLKPLPGPVPKIGTERTIKKFLLWPMAINREWRWLESVTYVEKVKGYHVPHFPLRGGAKLDCYEVRKWKLDRWDDSAEVIKAMDECIRQVEVEERLRER